MSIESAAESLDLPTTESELQALSQDQVKTAYREKIKEAHPDNGGSQEEFKSVKSAYETIESFVNSERQEKYTKSTSTQNTQPSTATTTSSRSTTKSSYKKSSEKGANTTNSTQNTDNYTQTKNTANNTKNTANTKSSTTTRNEETSAQKLYNKYTSNIVSRSINSLAFVSTKLNVLGLLTLSMLAILGYIQFGEFIAYQPPFEQYITTHTLIYLSSVTPVAILLNMRYETLQSITLFKKLPQETLETVTHRTQPIQYTLFTKLGLGIGSCGGLYTILPKYTSLTILESVSIPLAILVLYLLFRKKTPEVTVTQT
jgi:DNA mismatch repair ATPase MutL